EHEDLAQAQICFANGCRAQLTASRVSYTPSRWLQVYTSRGFVQVDFSARKATVVEPSATVLSPEWDLGALSADSVQHYRDHLFEELLVKRELAPAATNAIAEEHRDFFTSIREGRQARV